ncbi:MAG: segregation and condensation protein B [Parcubacteria bacterium C7867-005]|nr:MAG: segregation and condensation protein B [Parcubacteria bacterium C7867-005]
MPKDTKLESLIEAILFFKNEPITITELSKSTEENPDDVRSAVLSLQKFYGDRGIVLVSDGEKVTFGTSPNASSVIEKLQKEEFSRDLGRAGLETLSIILYKGPISRKEIDYIRGVNSGFIIRNLLIRGLVERSESEKGERSFSYKPTIELLRFLGVKRVEDLPEFETAFSKLESFAKTSEDSGDEPTEMTS